jgi:urease accessory protein
MIRHAPRGLEVPSASALRARAVAAAAALVALGAAPLHAHAGGAHAGGLLSGLAHPVSGLDHVLAMVAVGLWGAQLGPPAIWVLPVAFPIVMALGGMLGLLGAPLPGVEVGIAASAILLGAMVLTQARPPLWVAAALAGSLAVFHGHAHGTELPEGQSGLLYSLGFVVSTGLLHALGIALGLVHRWPWGKRAVRLAGGAVLSGGVYFLWKSLE